MKTYKGVNLNLLSACCHCSCCYQMLQREPTGKKAYRFSLHELGVMVVRMDVNVKITVLHKGQGLYYQLNGSSNLELVHWKKPQQTFAEKNEWMWLSISHLEIDGAIEVSTAPWPYISSGEKTLLWQEKETIVGGPVTWYLFCICNTSLFTNRW